MAGGRPRDWDPVADGDPIPGDPERMKSLGRTLRKTADELERQIRNLKAVADVDAWDNKSGKEFREKAKGNVKKLEAAFKRYDTAADAIGTDVTEVGGSYQDKLHASPQNYASDLHRAQEIADAALKEAQEADQRKGAAQKTLDGLSDKKGGQGSGDDKGADAKQRKTELEAKRDAAGDEISAAREKINEARRIRDNAAKRARESIDAVINHDSLKDGFWDSVVADIAEWTSIIATWCGILSLVVGWIPVIGQALAGVLGAIAMIATLVNTLATLVQVLQGNADWTDLGMAALGFLMMGVGKAFSKVAGRFAKTALGRLGKAGTASTTKQAGRAQKKINKMAGNAFKVEKSRPWGSLKESVAGKMKSFKLEPGEGWKSLKEPFVEPFSRAWKDNLSVLKPGSGNYSAAWSKMTIRGDGNIALGVGRSLSFADPGIASHLKDIKYAAHGLSDSQAVNRISRMATGVSLVGSGITAAGLSLDSNLNPLLS
ncbi:putative T7SS-secreted protein [Streptomyces sp. NPDC058001]|uniref:putative T7SS-secreted protein n=1 Tax=Streptomyces sp. NPDC058001 TaxID=3346300 RepID=UPI0036EBAC88